MMEEVFGPGMGWFYLFLLFCLASLVQLGYYWGIFSRLAFFRKKPKRTDHQPISVVICARNEYYNLKRNLPQFLDQIYEHFEVVVVNDSSDDETEYLLKSFSDQYPNLSVVHFRQNLNFFHGKKFPLSLGIKTARHDLILLADADCRPHSPYWIREMQSAFNAETQVVLGYGRYESRKGLLNKLIRFDTLHIAMQYLSTALAGMPYMGVGRNLAYRKSLFYKTGGFISHYHLPSGDDDLFINQVARRKNTRVEFMPEAQTVSAPKSTFSEWVKQKRRHITTGKYYKLRDKLVLGGFLLSQFLFYATFVILLVKLYLPYYLLAIWGLRTISQFIVFKNCMRRLDEKNLLLYLPVFELFFMVFNPLLSLSATILKEDTWK